jgi:hypothetical protein
VAIAYFDSSAFVKLLVDEDGSEIAAILWDEADAVVSSRLAHPEVTAALAAARRNPRLNDAAERRARTSWEDFWAATRVVELTSTIGDLAAALGPRHSLSGADAVHLGSALALTGADPIMVTWDARLATGSLATGLSIAPRIA